MSLNTISPSTEFVAESFKSILERYLQEWHVAPTKEAKLKIESKVFSIFESAEQRLISASVRAGLNPEKEDIVDFYNAYDVKLQLTVSKLRSLSNIFLSFFNNTQILLTEVNGNLNRVKQKQASFNLLENKSYRFLLAEKFHNYDRISASFNSLPVCSMATAQGIATLPIRSKTVVPVKKINVLSTSNGVAGNSDLNVTFNNSNIKSVLKTNPTQWFEYEKLDDGPVVLNVLLELYKPEIINGLYIEPLTLDSIGSFDLVDITFNKSDSATEYLSSMLPISDQGKQFEVSAANGSNGLDLHFLPIEVFSIVLKFQSDSSQSIEVFDANQISVLRDRYAIGLKHIALYRYAFDIKGGVASTVINIPNNLYSAIGVLDIFPSNTELYDVKLEVSFDSGENFQEISRNAFISQLIQMVGNESTINWRLSIKRKDEAFESMFSFNGSNKVAPQTSSILRTVSKYQSPAQIPIDDEIDNANIFVVQPKILRRGDRTSSIILGRGAGHAAVFEIPMSLQNVTNFNDIHVFVSGSEYTYSNASLEDLAEGEYSLSSDGKYLELGSTLPNNASIELTLDKEEVSFIEREDGYYAVLDYPFDPTKSQFVIEYLSKDVSRYTEIIPTDTTKFNLKFKSIIAGSLLLASDSVTYEEVATKALLTSATNKFYVDYKAGIVLLSNEIEEHLVSVSYDYHLTKTMSSDNFEFFWRAGKPAGIKISKENFALISVREQLNSNPLSVYSLIKGSNIQRSNSLATSLNKAKLSYKKILPGSVILSDNFYTNVPATEVKFVDGQTEFLGLILSSKERTQELTASISGIVSFNLAAGSLYYKELGFHTSNTNVFSSEKTLLSAVTSIGDYYINANGTVSVYVGNGNQLPSDIRLSYYYKDLNFNPNHKYSIDYKNGILYSYTAFNGSAYISYKSANYSVSYDIANYIHDFVYDSSTNSVNVSTESLLNQNNLVKIFWAPKSKNRDFLALKDFFTPIISLVGFRFS